jgi:hypothetical protein
MAWRGGRFVKLPRVPGLICALRAFGFWPRGAPAGGVVVVVAVAGGGRRALALAVAVAAGAGVMRNVACSGA